MSVFRTTVLAFWVAALAGLASAQAPSGTLPTVLAQPADVAIFPGATSAPINLQTIFGLPGVTGPLVQMQTVLGGVTVELYSASAPVTTANFLKYVGVGLWNNMIINRSIPGFVIQGGGYTVATTSSVTAVATFGNIINESGLSNVRGSLAMARTSDPNSGSNQWFINLVDNGGSPNNLDTATGGYAVFGRVIGTGMTVVDAIAAIPTYNFNSADFTNTPMINFSSSSTSIPYSSWVRFPTVSNLAMYPDGTGSPAALGFSVANSNPAAITATPSGSSLYLTGASAGSALITVTATDNNGNQVSASFHAYVAALLQQPASQTVSTGGTAVFSAALNAVPAGTTYQWLFNGTAIAGATSSYLAATQPGSYVCVITGGGSTLRSNAAILSNSAATDSGRLINLSVLTSDVTSSQSLTLGFVIGGSSGNETLLLRGSGPALQAFGLSNLLSDPLLTLYNASSASVASDAGWSSTTANQTAVTAASAATGAFALKVGSADSALVQSLSPGTGSADYTIVISGKSGDGGTTLGEVFDDTTAGTYVTGATHLKNLSSQVALKTGDTLTAGFTVGGQTAKTVLIRAVGPGLAAFGVPAVMADPQVKLFAAGNVIASNAVWGGDSQTAAIASRVGAFSLGASSADSVIVTTLAPGSYSAQVNSVSGAGGTALVEVYEVP